MFTTGEYSERLGPNRALVNESPYHNPQFSTHVLRTIWRWCANFPRNNDSKLTIRGLGENGAEAVYSLRLCRLAAECVETDGGGAARHGRTGSSLRID